MMFSITKVFIFVINDMGLDAAKPVFAGEWGWVGGGGGVLTLKTNKHIGMLCFLKGWPMYVLHLNSLPACVVSLKFGPKPGPT